MERKFHVSGRKTVSRVRSSRRRPGCMRLFVCPTTGGRLEISVSPRETVVGLKAALARKLRVPPTRITLIYKDKVLKDGCLLDHQIPDDSHVTLLPNMESGLSLHQSDKSIMQALENLTETQVNDFLSGRAPLMLAIRMGEHMVFVQLQLSTLQSQAGQLGPAAAAAAAAGGGPRPGVTAMTPAAASVLSQTGLSASALAEATRCLSQRLHRLQELNKRDRTHSMHQASTSSSSPNLSQPPSSSTLPPAPSPLTLATLTPAPTATKDLAASVSATTAAASAPGPTSSPQTLLQLLPRPTLPLVPDTTTLPSPPPSPGAVIDTMKHMGRGVYSGTFSGTLDPSLQDGNGQPRRSVNTILHILNDLLVAAPQSPTAKSPVTPQGQGPNCNSQLAFSFQPCPTNLPPTPPTSPRSKTSPASVFAAQEDPENVMLRKKMQRIQMMLAQRKEQRRKLREKSAPYTTLKSLSNAMTVSSSSQCSSSSSSSSSSSCISPSSSSSPAVTSLSSSSGTTAATVPSVCRATSAAVATTSTTTTNTPVSSHSEGESSPAYCASSLEQDSLAV